MRFTFINHGQMGTLDVDEGRVTSIQTANPKEMSELKDLISPTRFMTVTRIEKLLSKFGFSQIEIVSTPSIEKIDTLLTESGLYGSILIRKKGETLLRKGYGFFDIETKKRNTESTYYHCGRLSELFTTRLFYSKIEEGLFSLDDPLDYFFPSYCVKSPYLSEITLSMLLHHTSGFTQFEMGLSPILDDLSTRMILDQIFKHPLLFKPGTHRFESNANFRLLSAILGETLLKQETNTATLYESDGSKKRLDHLSFRRGFADISTTVVDLMECTQSLLDQTKEFVTLHSHKTNEMVSVTGPLHREFLFGRCTYSFSCDHGVVFFVPQDELHVALIINKPMPTKLPIKKLISLITTNHF